MGHMPTFHPPMMGQPSAPLLPYGLPFQDGGEGYEEPKEPGVKGFLKRNWAPLAAAAAVAGGVGWAMASKDKKKPAKAEASASSSSPAPDASASPPGRNIKGFMESLKRRLPRGKDWGTVTGEDVLQDATPLKDAISKELANVSHFQNSWHGRQQNSNSIKSTQELVQYRQLLHNQIEEKKQKDSSGNATFDVGKALDEHIKSTFGDTKEYSDLREKWLTHLNDHRNQKTLEPFRHADLLAHALGFHEKLGLKTGLSP